MAVTVTKTALVFTGGGSLGAVQVGMLKALVPHGLRPDFVVGSSVGAINAAYYVGEDGWNAISGLDRIWRSIHRKDIFPVSARATVLGFMAKRPYTVSPEPLRQLIQTHLQYERLENSKLPLYVVATDILNGSEFVLSSGPAVDALLASSAIPGVLPPIRIDQRYLSDGGIANNTPISTAISLGANRIIVLPTILSCTLPKPPRSAIGMALHALNIFMVRQMVHDTELFQKEAEIIIIPPLDPVVTLPYDFSHTAEMIDRSEEQTHQWIAENKARLSFR